MWDLVPDKGSYPIPLVVESLSINHCTTRKVLVVVQSLSRVWLFATPWTAEHQASLSFTISWSLLKFMFIESVMPSYHLIICVTCFSSRLQSFPTSGSFPMSQFFTSDGQSIGASTSSSVRPVNIQDWFPLGLTGSNSFQSKELSTVFSNTTVQKHQFKYTGFYN